MSKIETTSKVSLKPTSTINLERRRALATHRPHRSQPKQSATEAHQQDKPRKAGRAHTEAPTLDTAHNLFPPPPPQPGKGQIGSIIKTSSKSIIHEPKDSRCITILSCYTQIAITALSL